MPIVYTIPTIGTPFTPQEKDLCRTYMLVPRAFATPHALLEGIFEAIDGMINNPDDMGQTQQSIRYVLYRLVSIENRIEQYENLTLSSEVEGEVQIDAIRSLAMDREVNGPALLTQLASRLAFNPDGNYFDPVVTMPTGGGHVAYRIPRS